VFCGGSADFVRHREQHLDGRVIDVCRACHMGLHARLFRKEYFISRAVFKPLKRESDLVAVSFSLVSFSNEKLRAVCRWLGCSVSFFLSIAVEHLLMFDEEFRRRGIDLPVEALVQLATLATVGFFKGACLAYEVFDPSEPIYFDIGSIDGVKVGHEV